MFNDLSSPLRYLATRRSGRAREMVGPGPTDEQLDAILQLAARTPDHGKLFPWRFVIVAADQREEFAALLDRALDAQEPPPGAAHRQKAADFARSGEALVVMLSAPIAGHKIPVWEQELSVGAAAMNLLHAVHAHGFVGSWLTGWAAYDPLVREAFAVGPDERIAGFFFVGSPGRELEERPRPAPAQVIRRWAAPL
ncbi:nitroreductase [Sphingomonas sp. LHG3406-1]|uniref:nitroreductase family protein n=1 Tax=Sphingomonas sp. LHG3406-1 TaxID=2804617 RepID=UPI002618BFA2|nr:nitroreductase [Sphingomonas sp. LHG3406-1]